MTQEGVMIIQCESCKTEFNLDESMIKKGGSKVGCSVCKQVFVVYPPSQAFADEGDPLKEVESELFGSDSKSSTIPEESEGVPDKDDFLDGLDGLDDILGKPDSDLDGEKAVFDEAERNLLQKASEGEQDLAKHPLPDFPSMEQLVEEDKEPAEKYAPDVVEPEFPVREVKTKKKSSKFMVFLLIVFFLIIGAAAAFFYLRPELIPKSLSFLEPEKKQEQVDPGVRLLMFSSVSGGFAEAENGGRFFVIRGVVTNKYPEPRSFIQIKGSVLDDQGKVVQARTSYAGNSFTEEELKTLPFSEISKAMGNRDGMARKNFNVLSGAAVPFMIVFDNLEGSLSEFTVEAVSSSPGT